MKGGSTKVKGWQTEEGEMRRLSVERVAVFAKTKTYKNMGKSHYCGKVKGCC
jgi:hypothetical protein